MSLCCNGCMQLSHKIYFIPFLWLTTLPNYVGIVSPLYSMITRTHEPFNLKTSLVIPTWQIFPPLKPIATVLSSSLINSQNVDSPVTNTRLVLKMISGLTEAYAGFVTYIQQHDPLPTFAIAKSRLEFEESMMLQRAARDSGSSSTPVALMGKTPLSNDDVPRHSSPGYTYQKCNPPSNTSRGNWGKKNNHNNGGRNYGRDGQTCPNHFNDGGRGQGQQQWQQWMPW